MQGPRESQFCASVRQPRVRAKLNCVNRCGEEAKKKRGSKGKQHRQSLDRGLSTLVAGLRPAPATAFPPPIQPVGSAPTITSANSMRRTRGCR